MKNFLVFELNANVKKLGRDDIVVGIRRNLLNNNRAKLIRKNKIKREDLVNYINQLEIYLPFRELKKGRYQSRQKDYYINGYGFIEFNEVLDYSSLEKTPYIEYVIRSSENDFELLPEDRIREEQDKMEEFFKGTFKVGQLVEIVDGNFSNMLARVIGYEESNDFYKVVVATRSNVWRLRVPSDQLRIREEDLIVIDDYIEDEQ